MPFIAPPLPLLIGAILNDPSLNVVRPDDVKVHATAEVAPNNLIVPENRSRLDAELSCRFALVEPIMQVELAVLTVK